MSFIWGGGKVIVEVIVEVIGKVLRIKVTIKGLSKFKVSLRVKVRLC